MIKTYYYIALLIIALGCGIAAVFAIKQEPRRIENGVLITFFLCLTPIAILHLYMPDEYEPNGLILLGKGSEILFAIFILICVLSILLGIFLCINGVRLLKMEKKASLAHLLPILWGVFAIVWMPLFFLLLFSIPAHPNMRYVLNVFNGFALYIPLTLFSFLVYSIIYALLPKEKNPDFIICLGCGLKNKRTVTPLLASRLDKAHQVFMQGGSSATIIVSGGQGIDELVPESFAMKEYLIDKGIHSDQIIEENQSLSTLQNLTYSKALMPSGTSMPSSVFVSSNYHVLRAAIIAKELKMNTQGIGSPTAFYYVPAAFLREYIATMLSDKKLALFYLCIVALKNILYFFI